MTLVGHPFDTVKVRLQTQDFAKPLYCKLWDSLCQLKLQPEEKHVRHMPPACSWGLGLR